MTFFYEIVHSIVKKCFTLPIGIIFNKNLNNMKSLKRFVIVALVAMAAVVPASAQFRFGLKAGVAVSELKLNKDVFDSSNRAGFTGGIMAEFTVPVVNLGFDASVLYASRSVEAAYTDNGVTVTKNDTRSYIDIPINLKWKIGLPLVGNIITPFITTGPDFSFLCSKQNFDNAWNSRKFDVAWNVGAGVQLVNKIQIAASYGFGLTNSVSGDKSLNGSTVGNDLKDFNFKGKNRFWTITLAYLF